MTPDLSRRVGRGLHAADSAYEVHIAAQSWTGRVDDYAELPGWLRHEVERGEKRVARRR